MTPTTILLVEDNPEDVAFFKRALAKASLDCGLQVADDGQRAMERLSAAAPAEGAASESCPSHVILDLKLPKRSGLEVLAWIRVHPRLGQLPVIVLTSSDLPTDRDRAHALGIDAFMVKPLTSSGLLSTVREIADRWKLPLHTRDPQAK